MRLLARIRIVLDELLRTRMRHGVSLLSDAIIALSTRGSLRRISAPHGTKKGIVDGNSQEVVMI
jgi:hypothetical protein